MAFTLWNLFEASILCLNAICILHEERFLSKSDWMELEESDSPRIRRESVSEVADIKFSIFDSDSGKNSFDIS
ncbi:immediate early response 3-interacting protein 1 [Asbolus verrucosus]|uniref:Immediate early response 3-interacting protein 1 n=1 Tax=Asbolus verrucosus TaxID=1661398 RepID=A0A482W7V3_ASBVE|nr:immediate early response 3-interacting protein 1 [Asbolus verrucosus]